MDIRRSFGLVAMILLASGCTTSEHGLCPPDGGDRAVFDPALLGNWSFEAGAPDRSEGGLKINPDGALLRLERVKDGSKTYLITTAGADGRPAGDPPAVAHLVPIGAARYLDVLVGDPKSKDERRHVFLKVVADKDNLTFHLMNPWYFASHPAELASTSWAFSGKIPLVKGQPPEFSMQLPSLTAQTPELLKFLDEHANDAEVWPADWVVRCRRGEARTVPEQQCR